MRRFPISALAAALLLALLAATGPARAATFAVAVSSNVFTPSVLNIQVGDTVTWTNQQGFHNVQADGGAFTSGAPANAPWTFSFTFNAPGSFQYFCSVHGSAGGVGMSGMVNVTGGPTNPGSIRFSNISYSVNEASATATIQLQRVNGDDGAVSAVFATGNGTASAGPDYTGVNTVVSWADNDDDPKFVNIPIVNDSLDEPNETVSLTLSNPTGGATLGSPSSATLTIIDDDTGTTPGCVADGQTLCLLGDRFEVKARWETVQGASGQGQAVELTPDTGYFWFFNQNNVEMVIKVRNACVDPFNRFWVFAGGLTNVQVDITVRDTVSGTVKPYQNPLRTPFQPITDTDAFDTCP